MLIIRVGGANLIASTHNMSTYTAMLAKTFTVALSMAKLLLPPVHIIDHTSFVWALCVIHVFLWKSDCQGCAVLVCLDVCLFDRLLFTSSCILCNDPTQETSQARCQQVPCSAVRRHVLYASGVRDWSTEDVRVRWLCNCITSHPLLHSGDRHVDGGRGCPHVPETCHCFCHYHHQILSHRFFYLLV